MSTGATSDPPMVSTAPGSTGKPTAAAAARFAALAPERAGSVASPSLRSITEAVVAVIEGRLTPQRAVGQLMARGSKSEH